MPLATMEREAEAQLHDAESRLRETGLQIRTEADALATIEDDTSRDTAVAFLQRTKGMKATIAALYAEPIQQAHNLHKTLLGKRKALESPILTAEATIKVAVGGYETRKAVELAEQRRKADEAVRKAEAERQRLQAEANAKAQREAEEDRLAQAAELEAQGRANEADAVLDAPIYVPTSEAISPPPIAPPPPPIARTPMAGASTRQVWKFEITNAEIIPREFLQVNEVKIGAIVRTMKGTATIPGVRVYPEAVVAVR